MYLIFTITEIPKPHSSRVFTALSLVNGFVTPKGKAKFSYELGADFTPKNYLQISTPFKIATVTLASNTHLLDRLLITLNQSKSTIISNSSYVFWTILSALIYFTLGVNSYTIIS